jgi:hypothetical protein
MARFALLVGGLLLLQGCVSLNIDTAPIAAALPGVVSQFGPTTPTTTSSLPPGATGTCANGAQPASGTMVGTFVMGAYSGVALPGSFAVYQAEQDVTDRITGFSRDGSYNGVQTWTAFQCLFPAAVGVWRSQSATVVVPVVNVASPPPVYGPSPEPIAGSADDCPADINPANGTIYGSEALGVYQGALLPASFEVYQSEEEVTERIGRFADDQSATGRNTWIKFQCFYAQAVSAWRGR